MILLLLLLIVPATPQKASAQPAPKSAKPVCVLSALPPHYYHYDEPAGSYGFFGSSAMPDLLMPQAKQLREVETTVITRLCGNKKVGGDKRLYAALTSRIWKWLSANRQLTRQQWQSGVEELINHLIVWSKTRLEWLTPQQATTLDMHGSNGSDPIVGSYPETNGRSLYVVLFVRTGPHSKEIVSEDDRLACGLQPVW